MVLQHNETLKRKLLGNAISALLSSWQKLLVESAADISKNLECLQCKLYIIHSEILRQKLSACRKQVLDNAKLKEKLKDFQNLRTRVVSFINRQSSKVFY